MTITTRHWRGRKLKDGLIELTNLQDPPTIAGAILATKETAQAQIHRDTSARTFVEETDFTNSYLAVIEYFGSSSYSLKVQSIGRQESSIYVRVAERSQSDYITADLAPHSLFIRITEESPESPTDISAEIVS